MDRLRGLKKDVLRKFITGYNRTERKRTYSGAWRMRKDELVRLIQRDFNPTVRNDARNRPSLYLKHKTGRFTRKVVL